MSLQNIRQPNIIHFKLLESISHWDRKREQKNDTSQPCLPSPRQKNDFGRANVISISYDDGDDDNE